MLTLKTTQPPNGEAGPDLIAAILSYWVSLTLICQCTIELLSCCNTRLKIALQTLEVRIGLNHCSWQYCCISVQCLLYIQILNNCLNSIYEMFLLWNILGVPRPEADSESVVWWQDTLCLHLCLP